MKLTADSWLAPRYGWTREEYERACARTAPVPDPAPRHQSPPTSRDDAAAALMAALGRPSWHAHAVCRGAGTSLFFSQSRSVLDQGRALCSRCPVRDQCLEYAEAGGEAGTWGGMTAAERTARRATAA